MAYCTLADLKKALPEEALIELSGDSEAIDETVVDATIADADSVIDSYLGSRYTVPLSTVPALIRRLSCAIVIYYLYQRRSENIEETRENAYRRAIKTLEKINRGEMALPAVSGASDGFASGVLESTHFQTTSTTSGLEDNY